MFNQKKKTILTPLMHGGESSSIYRSGSVPLGIIASIEKALYLAYQHMDKNYEKVKSVNAYLLEQIKSNKKIKINSFSNPYIVNLSIDNITGRTAVDYLNSKGICVSQKSACSIKNTPSKIIMAIYKDKKRAISSFRLSLSELVTYEEIDYLVETLKELAK